MMPRLASIFLDYKCNFECGHCSIGSSPRTVMPMPRQMLLNILRDLRDIPTIKTVTFTGGEPTLRKDLLLEGIRICKEYGFMPRVVTNGYWASTPERADRFVAELKEAGLEELNTSFDDFHAEFTSIDRPLNLVRAGVKHGLRIAAGVIVKENAQFTGATLKQALAAHLDIPLAELNKTVYVIEDFPAPTGTGQHIDTTYADAAYKMNLGCSEIVKTISFHPNGTVKMCCGHAMLYAKDLTAGNVEEQSVSAIMERAQHNLLYWMIHMKGPKQILDDIGVTEQSFSHICHACHVLLTEHREAAVAHIRDNSSFVTLKDLALSNGTKRAAELIASRKSEIISKVLDYKAKQTLCTISPAKA